MSKGRLNLRAKYQELKNQIKKPPFLSELQQFAVGIRAQPNFPIMILIFLTGFYDCASLSRISLIDLNPLVFKWPFGLKRCKLHKNEFTKNPRCGDLWNYKVDVQTKRKNRFCWNKLWRYSFLRKIITLPIDTSNKTVNQVWRTLHRPTLWYNVHDTMLRDI